MTTALVVAIVAGWPRHMCVSAGGLSVESFKLTRAAWHDAKSGYFVSKTFECDGSHRRVLMTRDRRMLEDEGYDMSRFGRQPKEFSDTPVEERAFALKTSGGIAIGMTKATVVKRLGKPARTAVRGAKGEYWCALYKSKVMEDRESGQILRNTYILKNGKLIEIAINLDAIPGCGEDSLSDEGWPWTKF